ncbi:MAG: HIT domain-containing protein [Rickettsiales bacterium]|nr:HIT domain-containing protein [Rickettsiales bacterium]
MNITYDQNNIFAKIIKKEIPTKILYEDEFCIAFNDIQPSAPIHILIVPKGEFISFNDFALNASPEFISGFFKSVQKIAEQNNLIENGFRTLFNHGKNASQSVFHFHVHLLGGRPLGAIVAGDTNH